jgi:hypothetical protein
MMSPAMTHLQMTKKITRSHPISSEGFRSDSERVFQNVELVYEKYHICMLSTNVNQDLAFQALQWTWWVYQWGAVIPLLEDTLKECGFLQVMTQVIGQESYQAALHPLPAGSSIMGGQGKE